MYDETCQIEYHLDKQIDEMELVSLDLHFESENKVQRE
jgi:hypothetical protein